MKQIDLAIPENAKNVTITVTYQLEDKDLSTSQRVLLAMRYQISK